MKALVACHDAPIYRELRSVVLEALQEAGIEARLHEEGGGLGNEDALLLVGRPERLRDLEDLLRGADREGLPAVIWHTEPLPPPGFPAEDDGPALRLAAADKRRNRPRASRPIRAYHAARFALQGRLHPHTLSRIARHCGDGGDALYFPLAQYRWLRQTLHRHPGVVLWVSNAARQAFLRERGVESRIVPVGDHAMWGSPGDNVRDIDALFLGQVTRRRSQVLDDLRVDLSKRGVRLEIRSGDTYGAQRTALLQRTRVLVHLPKNTWEMPSLRVPVALACGVLIVSERVSDPAPWRPGRDFVMAEPAELAATVEAYARNEEKRDALVASGRQFLSSELAMSRLLSDALRDTLNRSRVQSTRSARSSR